MKKGRPYPPDMERRALIRTELSKRNMTINALSKILRINQGNLSCVINGIRRSKKTEEKIAAFFGKEIKELFPPRTKRDLENMRKAAVKRGAA